MSTICRLLPAAMLLSGLLVSGPLFQDENVQRDLPGQVDQTFSLGFAPSSVLRAPATAAFERDLLQFPSLQGRDSRASATETAQVLADTSLIGVRGTERRYTKTDSRAPTDENFRQGTAESAEGTKTASSSAASLLTSYTRSSQEGESSFFRISAATVPNVPEPSTFVAVGSALAGLIAIRRKRASV